MKQLFEILIPSNFNDGARITLQHHHNFDEFVQSLAGGLTIMKPVRGLWKEETSDNTYHEPMIPVRIYCTEEQITTIANFALQHYQQQAIMAYKLSDSVLIIEKGV